MITDKETNKVYFSVRLRDFAPEFAEKLERILSNNGVGYEFIEDSYSRKDIEEKYPVFNTLDIWCRDYMPIQVSEQRYVHFHYFPEYLLDTKKYRATITNSIRVELMLKLDCDNLNLILDGGNVIKTDDSVIITSKVYQDNAPLSKEEINARLVKAFGVPVIIIDWNEGDKYDYLGHADGIVRYVGNYIVLMPNPAFSDGKEDLYLKKVVMQLAKHFTVEYLPSVSSDAKSKELNWGYINFLRVGNFILVPIFNINDDTMIMNFFNTSNLFDGCRIEFIDCSKIAKADGVLNCISWTVKE